MPQSIHNVRAFHGLASFYRRFIRGFITTMVHMTEVIKGTSFVWTPKAQAAFEEIKARLTKTPVLTLPCFSMVLKWNVMPLVLALLEFLLRKVNL